ncbi:cyclase family protein [Spongisporangium articulatum]|uniref:Cyclase family protein n=1 Tax=Spongisporangium articulatum TaxID=3362603 RepID=A0ABW8AJJ2_9ACTN
MSEVERRIARRRALAVAAVAPLVVAWEAGRAEATDVQSRQAGPIPRGYAGVDPRTARRVPLWQELAPSNPIFPGDPAFTSEIWTTVAESGYLLEHITSLGTHTGTHISAPAHFHEGAQYLSELDETFALMPLAVIDVSRRVQRIGGDFSLDVDFLKAWERRHGRYPARGCVLLYTGFSLVFSDPAYFDPAPGFTGDATAWLFEQRGIFAVGSDTFGPDATSDEDFSATSTALAAGGITVENVGAGLAKMRAHGDWVSINGGRPRFSGFQMGITGFTR